MSRWTTLPPSGSHPSSYQLWVSRLALILCIALVPTIGLPAAHAEPLDKAQPGLLNISDARRALSTLQVDRDGANGGLTRPGSGGGSESSGG